MKIGKILIELRVQSKKTQKEIANIIGVTKGTLSHWEGNISEPTFLMLEKLAKVYNVQIGYFFNDKSATEFEETKINMIDKILEDISLEGIEEINNFDELDLASKQLLLGAINKQLKKKDKNSSNG